MPQKQQKTADAAATTEEAAAEETAETAADEAATAAAPKYVFLFIGDGMSYPQIQTTNYYLNAIEDDGERHSYQREQAEHDELPR